MAREPAVTFIAVSKAIRQRAVDYGIPAEKVSVAYIGVDVHRFKPGGLPLEQRRKRILFVGRMVEKKAPLLMVQAFAEVRKQMPEAELVMIGEGPLLAAARALAAQLGVPVEFLGASTSDDVLAQMHEARVFCLPSVTASNGDAEGLPISVLEAQACGVPVVTSARGAVGEAVTDGESGLCVGEFALTALASCLTRLLRDDRLSVELSTSARTSVVKSFSNRDAADSIACEFNKATLRYTASHGRHS
jgi:glycosyltransferase involved in cell wall biosynthesis